jgi:hypothetical protein
MSTKYTLMMALALPLLGILSACGGQPTAEMPAAVETAVEMIATEVAPPTEEMPEAMSPLDSNPTVQAEMASSTTMQTGQGVTMTLTLRNLDNSRGWEYCELVFNYGDIGSDIYSTSPLAPCDETWWDNLDLDALAQEFGAQSVTKNGPEWWSMDQVQVMGSEPVEVAGVQMLFGAHLPPGTMETPLYEVFNPAKNQNLVWKAGRPTYRLTDPDGNVYVIQGYKVPEDQLATLGDQMTQLPEGWTYTVVNPTEDLVFVLTTDEAIPSVKDEFDQIYIRVPEGS